MTWLRIDDRAGEDPKLEALSNQAHRLWFRAGCWVASHLTDGFIPADVVPLLAKVKRYQPLVEELLKKPPIPGKKPLWHAVEGGYVINDYLDYNPSAAQVKAQREANRDRQAKHRNGRRGSDDPAASRRDEHVSNGVTSSVTNGVTNGEVTPLVTHPRPVPSRPLEKPTTTGRAHDPVENRSTARSFEAVDREVGELLATYAGEGSISEDELELYAERVQRSSDVAALEAIRAEVDALAISRAEASLQGAGDEPAPSTEAVR